MVYIVENNGVYGLTKGQFSATADKGSKSKTGVVNTDAPIDLVGLALLLGATFVARSFSGDKEQLVPLIKAAIATTAPPSSTSSAPASPSTTTPGSTKSYDYVREHNEAVNRLDFIAAREQITADYAPGTRRGGDPARRLGAAPAQAAPRDYDPHDRIAAMTFCRSARRPARSTGLLYVDPDAQDLHAHLDTVPAPLNSLGNSQLCPGAKGLDAFNAARR